MKLTRKLVAALMVGVFAVLATHAALRVHREVVRFEADVQQDDGGFGRMLARMVATMSKEVGAEKTLALLEHANPNGQPARIRWVWLDAPAGDPRRPRVPVEELTTLAETTQVTVRLPPDQNAGDSSEMYTYTPLDTGGGRRLAIELAESLAGEASYVRDTVLDIILETSTIVLVCGVLAVALGVLLIGRPVRAIIEMARSIGRGDLTRRLTLRQRDELGELATEMNLLCVQLTEANEKVEAETAARLEAIESLRHADRLTTVGKLASGVAHELGTPLNVISGRAQLVMTEYPADSVAHENATIIRAQSRRMTAIVRQLLDFARRSHGKTDRCDVHAIAAQAVQMLVPQAQKQNIDLVLAGAGPALANVNEGQLQQAINNLIMNAIDASPAGGTITVAVEQVLARRPSDQPGDFGLECLRLSVKDHGTGIAPHDLPHIFEPFFTTKEVGKGTGLGLSVTHGIVEDQGGWIEVDSEIGRGSCFSILLPKAEAA
jgi:two-component system NtrC family sensor kinase